MARALHAGRYKVGENLLEEQWKSMSKLSDAEMSCDAAGGAARFCAASRSTTLRQPMTGPLTKRGSSNSVKREYSFKRFGCGRTLSSCQQLHDASDRDGPVGSSRRDIRSVLAKELAMPDCKSSGPRADTGTFGVAMNKALRDNLD